MSETPDAATKVTDLAQLSFPRLCFHLLRGRFNGLVQLTQPGPSGGARTIWVRGGMPVFTDWHSEDDRLGEILVSRGLIDKGTRDGALAHAQQQGKPLGLTLVGGKILEGAKLSAALRLQCTQKLLHVFALREGQVRLVALDALDLPAEIDGQVNVLQLVLRGVLAHYDEARIRHEMGGKLMADATASKALTRYQNQFGFAKGDVEALRSLLQGTSLSDFGARFGVRGLQLVFTLWACQMLHLTDAPASRPAGAPRSRPREGSLPPPPGIVPPEESGVPPPPTAQYDTSSTPPPPPIHSKFESGPPDPTRTPGASRPSGPPPIPSSRPSSRPAAGSSAPPSASREAPGPSRASAPASESERAELVAEIERFEAQIKAEDNAFKLFGLELDAGRKEVRQVWADLSKRLHPDSLEARALTDLRPRVAKVFAAISEAYGTLSNKDSREDLVTLIKAGGSGKKNEDAAKLVKRALEGEMQLREAERHVKAGRYGPALASFRKAAELSVEDPELDAGLIFCEFASGQHGESQARTALEALESLTSDNPNLANGFFYRGMVGVMSGKTGRSVAECFTKALEINPRLIEAQRQLHALNVKRRQAKETTKPKKKGFGGIFGR